jgi:hypothetical protein
MTVRWLQAVIDIPTSHFGVGSEFWRAVSASSFGVVHPDHDEFVHLEPAAGDMHLELQRTNGGLPGVHLDLLVDDIDGDTRRATDLGAQLVSHPGHSVLETPGGVRFCVVPFGGESNRAPAVEHPTVHAVDQICLDTPAGLFGADVAFWSDFTGWAPNPPVLDEFCSFAQPQSLPIRLLVHRLGAQDTAGGRAHLDLSCGTGTAAVTEWHQTLGATVQQRHEHWTVMTDPAGMQYCLTSRKPR